MSQHLEDVFGELGISQYLDAFVDQGFDSWETILDITESDLDALGVKLGHRRKLQRRIANTRGLAPDASLVSPTRPSIEDPRGNSHLHDGSHGDSRQVATVVITKRKYRRHPKPDENAPERPPSAYVLFSNKMRDDLKGRNLTFTEIAKLVGENWQNISTLEKEPFEAQAQTAKDRYNNALADYKKTSQYRSYMSYLQEFKAKHSNQKLDKEASKRLKLSERSRKGGSPRTSGPSRSGTGSDAERHDSSEPPPSQWRKRGTGSSALDDRHSPPETPSSRAMAVDASMRSPLTTGILGDRGSIERSPVSTNASRRESGAKSHDRKPSWAEVHRGEEARYLPSLSDIFDRRALANGVTGSSENTGFPFPPYRGATGSPAPSPSLRSGDSRTPSLLKEQSSAGSVSSAATSAGTTLSHPRTPLEGPLPIHALLAGQDGPGGHEAAGTFGPSYQPLHALPDGKSPYPPIRPDPISPDHLVNGIVPMPYSTGPIPLQPIYPTALQHASPPPLPSGAASAYLPPISREAAGATPQAREGGLDGMSALLRAGEIVDRQPPPPQ